MNQSPLHLFDHVHVVYFQHAYDIYDTVIRNKQQHTDLSGKHKTNMVLSAHLREYRGKEHGPVQQANGRIKAVGW